MKHLASSTKPLHIETQGCIINIRPGLRTSDGHDVTSVEIICDQYAGNDEFWQLADHDNARTINVRVVRREVSNG